MAEVFRCRSMVVRAGKADLEAEADLTHPLAARLHVVPFPLHLCH